MLDEDEMRSVEGPDAGRGGPEGTAVRPPDERRPLRKRASCVRDGLLARAYSPLILTGPTSKSLRSDS